MNDYYEGENLLNERVEELEAALRLLLETYLRCEEHLCFEYGADFKPDEDKMVIQARKALEG